MQRRHLVADATMEAQRAATSMAQTQARITDGTRPGQLVTRCQAAIMAKRAAERKEA